MPTYEYACTACGHKFEEFQSMSAKPIKKCPACKKNKVQRLISGGAGFIFKGSGFYITDYRSDSYKEAAKAESGGGKSETAKTESTKSAAKCDSKSTSTAKTGSSSESSGSSKPAKSSKTSAA